MSFVIFVPREIDSLRTDFEFKVHLFTGKVHLFTVHKRTFLLKKRTMIVVVRFYENALFGGWCFLCQIP